MAGACSGCGQAIVGTSRFCTRCGRPLPSASLSVTSCCATCSAPLGPGQRFCTRCGSARGPGVATPAPSLAAQATRQHVSRWALGGAIVLALGLGTWTLVGREGGDDRSGERVVSTVARLPSGPIRVEMPAGAPEAEVEPTNLARTRAMPGGARLLASGRFGPSGLVIPAGAQVTFTLAELRPAGTQLPMLVLNEERQSWMPTGVMATVLEDGSSAEGRIYHFSEHGAGDDDNEGLLAGRRITVHATQTIDPERLRAALEAYERNTAGGEITLAGMQDVYREAGDFHVVKTLIEDGKISAKHSTDMADLRILMILKTLERMCSERSWRMYRSDSGNQSAGMSSDVDQTVYVEELKDGRWVRSEAADAALVREFPGEFSKDHPGLTVEVFDIATIAGADKFPDHRVTRVQLEAEGRRAFAQHARETMFTLRRTPGAYTFCGAVVQQMQLRVMSKVEESLRAGRTAPEIADPRLIHAELAAHNPDLRLNHLLCMQIGPGEGGDTAVRAREAFQEDAVRIMFDGLPPKLLRGHAYDAAVANYFEFMHHLEDKYPAVKYHLRAFDDAIGRLHSMDTGTERVEYAAVPEAERPAMLRKVFGQDLATPRWDGTSFLDRWQTAFDISARLRELHSAKQLTPQNAEEAYRKLATEIAVQKEMSAIHETGALDMHSGVSNMRAQMEEAAARVRRSDAWREHVAEARSEYDRRCQEFMLQNMVATANERVAEFVSPDAETLASKELLSRVVDEGPLRRQLQLEGADNEARWLLHREEFVRNHAFQAEMQLLYSLRQLRATRPDLVAMILKDAERRLGADDFHRLSMVARRSKSWFFGLTEMKAFPRTVLRYGYLAGKANVVDLAGRMGSWALNETGWVDSPDNPRPTDLLKTLGMHGLHERLRGAMQVHKTAGLVDRFAGKTFMHPGTAVGFSAIMRAFSESGGDPDVLQDSIRTEAINLLPLIGMGVGAYQAGTSWEAHALLWGPILVPELGLVVVCYAIGENALVLYEHEISAPLDNAVADAIYRGYVGPSLYQFARDETPPQLTDDEARRLTILPGVVEELTARMENETADRITALALAGKVRELRELEAKAAAWKAYANDDRLRQDGGAMFNQGGFESQHAIHVPEDVANRGAAYAVDGPLLARVKPVIFYAPDPEQGPVDFRVKGLTDAEEKRLGDLARLLAEPQHPAEWVTLRMEQDALVERKLARKRADDYLAKARTNRELEHQIRRDSLFPHVQEEPKNADPRFLDARYVAFWVASHGDAVRRGLERLGASGARPESAEALNAVHARLIADFRRSQRLWGAHHALLEAKREAAEKQRVRAQSALEAERLMVAAIQRPVTISQSAQDDLRAAGSDPRESVSPAALGRAILERHLPESGPRLDLRLRIVEREEDGKRVKEYRPETYVEANPQIFVPPYVSVSHALDPLQARQALGAGSWKGLPLDQDMRDAIETHLERLGPTSPDFDPKQHDWTPCVLTYVFCSDVRIEPRVVPATVAHLPRPQRMNIPLPDGMGALPEEMRSGFLLGGGALVPKTTVVTGKVRIEMGTAVNPTFDVVVVVSEALAKLEKGAEGGVLLSLHRASAEGGLAKSKPVDTVFVDAGTAVEENLGDVRQGRIDRDRYRFAAPMPDESADERGPFFYQVVQTSATGTNALNASPAGKPERSNVLGPKPEIRLGSDAVLGKTDTLAGEGMSALDVGLASAGQRELVAGAHLKVRYAGGTWHYWAPRLVGDRPAGTDPLANPWIRMQLHEPLENVDVELEAEGAGMKATRKFRVLASAAAKERAESNERYWMGRASRERVTAGIEAARRRVEGARQGLADFQARFSGQGWHGQQSIANAEMDLRAAETAAALFEQVEVPFGETEIDERIAAGRGDFSAVVAIVRRQIALREQEKSLQEAHATAVQGALAALGGAAPDASSKAHYASRVEAQRRTRKSVEGSAWSKLRSLGDRLANAGLEAGDAAACRDGHALAVKALEFAKEQGEMQPDEYARDRGGQYVRLADDMARLTGHRAQSKALLEEGRRLLLEGAAPERRDAMQAAWEREPLPPWWPEE